MCLYKQFKPRAFDIYIPFNFLFFDINVNRPSDTADNKILDD